MRKANLLTITLTCTAFLYACGETELEQRSDELEFLTVQKTQEGSLAFFEQTGDPADGEYMAPLCVDAGSDVVIMLNDHPTDDTCISEDGMLDLTSSTTFMCSCVDSNGVPWTQDCPSGQSCTTCCGNNGGGTLKKIWVKTKPGVPFPP